MPAMLYELELMPDLLAVAPFENEGQHIVDGTDKTLYLDHHWDETFGFAFGYVGRLGKNVTGIEPGQLVYFTRHAYESWRDKEENLWLMVNKADVQAVFSPGENEDTRVVEAANCVDRDIA